MYLMLFYDKYLNQHSYQLIKTDRTIEELEIFVNNWLIKNTNIQYPAILNNQNRIMPFKYNPVHTMFMLPQYYEVKHEYNHKQPIEFMFLEVEPKDFTNKDLIETSEYYLVLVNHNDRYKAIVIQTNEDPYSHIVPVIEKEYNFKCATFSKNTLLDKDFHGMTYSILKMKVIAA